MKKIGALAVACTVGLGVQAQTIIDSFNNSSLSAYTLTPVLYSGTSPDTTTISFSDSSGSLQATASSYNNIEQALFLQTFSMNVGDTLSVTLPSWIGTSQDFGLCVASTATPTAVSTTYSGSSTSTRSDLSYAFVGVRGGANHLVASGFDGATSIATAQYQPGGTQVPTTLFITETAVNTFMFGAIASTVSTNGGAIDLLNYTFVNNTGVGDAVGFYVDMRAANTIGSLQNLTLVPEPSTLALCGTGLLGLAGWMRRKK